MSDSDDLDLDGGDAPESGGASKKRGGGLGNLLPTILKFVAIGLGVTIFIVTVSVITVNIVNNRGARQSVVNDPLSPYVGRRPEYSYFENLGQITVRTRDYPASHTVSVEMVIGYDLNDQAASQELTNRRLPMIDFLRNYFSRKSAAELAPERDEELKAEIREMLNTRFLDTARAREILFKRLDLMEVH